MFGSGGCAGRRCRGHDVVHHYAGCGASCHDVDHLGEVKQVVFFDSLLTMATILPPPK